MRLIVYILNHILLTPACFAVMAIAFAAIAILFVAKRKAIPNTGKTVLCVPLALCVLYFLFIVWFAFCAGGSAH